MATALNATYFSYFGKAGFSDAYFTNAMGWYLNFSKNATSTSFIFFSENDKMRNSGVIPINPIDVIEINDYITIAELESVLAAEKIFPAGKNLIGYLAELPADERKRKIAYYNQQVEKRFNKRMGASSIDLGSSILEDVAGAITGFGALGTAISAMKILGRLAGKLPFAKNINRKIEAALYDTPDKANINFLYKINRVARVRKYGFLMPGLCVET